MATETAMQLKKETALVTSGIVTGYFTSTFQSILGQNCLFWVTAIPAIPSGRGLSPTRH